MKTYLPIHSSNPEERFVVEKWMPHSHPEVSRDNPDHSSLWNEWEIKMEKELDSRTKYPFPALTREMPDELIEGRDFELEYCVKRSDENWHEVDSKVYEMYSTHARRIIAVPLSVKSGEESELWKDVQKIMAHTKYPLDYARTSDNKSNLNIFVVDIPKVIEILKSKYKISPIATPPHH